MTDKATARPWRFEYLGGELEIVSWSNPAKRILRVDDLQDGGDTHFPTMGQRQNARLIVRAVNAHDALQRAVDLLLDATEDGDTQEVGGEPLESARHYARALLARIEGE